MKIDWADPHCRVSRHFSVKEAIWLPKWDRLSASGDGLGQDAETALRALFLKFDVVRDFIGVPILVHVAFRPVAYNAEVKGAKESAHMARREGGLLIAAVDWSADVGEESAGENCDTIRAAIEPKLDEWGLRMERGPLAPWIHLDSKPPGPGGRYFSV